MEGVRWRSFLFARKEVICVRRAGSGGKVINCQMSVCGESRAWRKVGGVFRGVRRA